MRRNDAVELAREHAARSPERYIPVDIENFHPDEWVLQAILAAYQRGREYQAGLQHWH